MNEIFTQFFGTGYSFMTAFLAFIVVLTPVVFFHELGHFAVARWNGVDVEAFSIGFGKELFGWNDAKGTRWKVCLIPLGGYVKFAGDANAASVPDFEQSDAMSEAERAGSCVHKTVWQRAAVVIAGPMANFLLAMVIFTGCLMYSGKIVLDPVVASVLENSAAAGVGIKQGDIIRGLNGKKITEFRDIQLIVGPNAGREMELEVERDGARKVFQITPVEKEIKDRFGNPFKQGLLGISASNDPSHRRNVDLGPVGAFNEAAGLVWLNITMPLHYIKDIIIGQKSADLLGGPVRIAKFSSDFTSLGLYSALMFIGTISVLIGFFNLLPVPMLDGGHLVFYFIEAIRGRPVSPKIQEMAFTVGMFAMMSLMLFTFYNDINFLRKLF